MKSFNFIITLVFIQFLIIQQSLLDKDIYTSINYQLYSFPILNKGDYLEN